MNFAVIEDSRSQAEVLKAILKSEGHHVDVFPDGASILEALKVAKFDFFVLDWVLPDMGGDKILTHIRQTLGWEVPIVVCTSCSDEESAADILRLGADDYMSKPIRYMEFMARIHRMLQSRKASNPVIQRHGIIELDTNGRRIRISGIEVDLTQREYDLAVIFLENIGRVLPREELMSRIWARDSEVDTRTVDTHASRLRKKLGLAGESGMVLTAVYGQGYRLDPVSQG